MEFEETQAEREFRQEVRAFVRASLPPHMAQRTREVPFMENGEDILGWMKILSQKGWLVAHWPKEYGGLGWTANQIHIFDEECALADAPEPNMQTIRMVGPVIYTYGTPEQKERFLPAIRNAEYMWTQGFSEPNAGSDLASLSTRGEKVEGGWKVNGQKIWSSFATDAEWAFVLVRTDPTVKKQAGISFMVVKLDTPGLTIRPIRQYNGDAHFCEMFFEDLFIPDDQVIGQPGMGWTYAKFLLNNERTASAFIYWNKRQLLRAGELLDARRATLSADRQAELGRRLIQLKARLRALDWSVMRIIADEESRWPVAVGASTVKITGARLQQDITQLQCDIIGVQALRDMPRSIHAQFRDGANPLWPQEITGIMSNALIMRAASVFGGAEQIQKNIISGAALGL